MAQPASEDMALDDPATAKDIIVVLRRTKQETASAALETVPGWQDTEEGRKRRKSAFSLDVSKGTADNKRKRNEPLPFKDTKQAVEVLQAASFLGCETSIQACCDYLNAAVWSGEEADTIKEVVKGLGSEVVKALADKLAKFEADAEFLEPLFETLLSGMLDGNETAEDLISIHAKLEWQGLSQEFVKDALSKKIVEVNGEFRRLLYGGLSYDRAFYLGNLSLVSQLLRFCLMHGVCHSEAIEAVAKPEFAPRFSAVMGRHCSDQASAEIFFGFISNVLTLIQCTSLEEEKKVQIARAWILAGACLGNFTGYTEDLASCTKNLFEVAKDLFVSFSEADQDVCRHEWAALRETDASSGNLVQKFAWTEATNFGASDPMVLMRMHLKGGFGNRKLSEAVSKFTRSCPELVPELIGSWNQLEEQPNLCSSG
ncbi:hypothetical protein KFL_001210130 [Klebsormidium nitens]|uniref:Uncharacterized protein n=1 Tax=Klebsormidium nitens TaxID=105231 RepID=A0A1Y1HZX0_KLENI|nr:hypothetical protein KFL_001210130 [Klebsormidium nitens]|eukprot:GAQ82719.1 hypothetical protein KFL_001210130 [Klebsormidium nitens]